MISDFINEFIFPHEGIVYENVPGDNGGPTKFGIDQASHPDIDIEGLNADRATAIYIAEWRRISWEGFETRALEEFPGNSGHAFFDAREVCGLTAAWKFAQRALELTPDGAPGSLTRMAVLSAPAATFTQAMIDERRIYHKYLAATRSNDAQFLKGWLNRCDDLERYLLG